MRVRLSRMPLVLCSIVALCLAAVAFAAEPPPPVKVASVSEFPEAVQKTVRAESVGAKIRGLWKEVAEDGKTVYEVEMLVKGRAKDMNIAEDGTLLVVEQQVALAEVPESVRKTMLEIAGKRKIKLVESVTKLGKLAYYEAHVVSGKSLEEVTVGLDGVRMP